MIMQNAMSFKQECVLATFKKLEEPIGEDEYHITHFDLDSNGQGIGFGYELAHWHDVDSRFISRYGPRALPFSPELHGIIDDLVGRGAIKRNPNNPIELSYNGD